MGLWAPVNGAPKFQSAQVSNCHCWKINFAGTTRWNETKFTMQVTWSCPYPLARAPFRNWQQFLRNKPQKGMVEKRKTTQNKQVSKIHYKGTPGSTGTKFALRLKCPFLHPARNAPKHFAHGFWETHLARAWYQRERQNSRKKSTNFKNSLQKNHRLDRHQTHRTSDRVLPWLIGKFSLRTIQRFLRNQPLSATGQNRKKLSVSKISYEETKIRWRESIYNLAQGECHMPAIDSYAMRKLHRLK